MTELRDIERELGSFRMRLFAAAAFVLFCFGLLAARLVYLQVVRHALSPVHKTDAGYPGVGDRPIIPGSARRWRRRAPPEPPIKRPHCPFGRSRRARPMTPYPSRAPRAAERRSSRRYSGDMVHPTTEVAA